MTPWTAACQASLSLTISQGLPKFMSIELVMSSNLLILCHPLLLLPSILPIIRVFSNESAVGIRWPKYWSFTFSINLSKAWFPLILLVWSPCCPKDSQESSPAPQFEIFSYFLFHIIFLYSLLENIEYTPLCYTVGSYFLSTLYIIVSSANPKLLICPSLPIFLPLLDRLLVPRTHYACHTRVSKQHPLTREHPSSPTSLPPT